MNKKFIITTLLLIVFIYFFVTYSFRFGKLPENRNQASLTTSTPITTINKVNHPKSDNFYFKEIEQLLYKSEYKKDTLSKINFDVSVTNKKTNKINKINFEGNVFQNSNPKFDTGMLDFSLLNTLGYKSEYPIDTGTYVINAINTAGPQGGTTIFTKIVDNNLVVVGFKSGAKQLAFISNIYNLNEY